MYTHVQQYILRSHSNSSRQAAVKCSFMFSQCEQINLIMTKLVSCHRFTWEAPAVHLGERWCMCSPWKWSYRSSTQNIKQCLVCCLLKSRTNDMEAKQHQGFTIRRKTQKKLYLEWNSIFLTPKCVPSSPPTLSWAPSSSRRAPYSFVNGLPPCSHPRIRYSMRTWGILLWLLVSCFLWKIQPPLSHTHMQTHSRTRHIE